MGISSSVEEQKIKVIDKDGLKNAKKILDKDWGCIISNEGNINFNSWNGWGLIGYWYPECEDVLIKIAKYIEGYVELLDEPPAPLLPAPCVLIKPPAPATAIPNANIAAPAAIFV